MTHELKTDSEPFLAVANREKNFEVRLNDRNFHVGDFLLLRETAYSAKEMYEGKPLKYTGNQVVRVVTYILHGPAYALAEGYCILSIE